jgi:hypothetical protein
MSTIVKIWLAFVLLLGLLLYVAPASAQTTILLPPPRIQFLDNLGKPLAGGFVYTYLAGTSIQQATYTDSTGATLNPNPIVLDAGGFASIYLTNATSYRIVVQNLLGVQQYVADNVRLVSSAQVGGSNTQIQYNCSGTFCGSSGMTYNSGTQTLSVTSLAVSTGGSFAGTFAGNPIFSGTVTFSGTVNFGAISASSLSSTCSPVASSGFIRMCNLGAGNSQINWRDFTNSFDWGMSTSGTAADQLVTSAPGGFLLTGASPNVRFGGTSGAFPMWKRSSATLQARLADDSADTAITASTVAFNGSGGASVVISGPCTTGQVLTAASANSVTCATASPGVLKHQSSTTLVNTAIPNSSTTVISLAVTMPSAGCPCRAVATWWLYLSTGNSGQDVAYVSDATTGFAGSETATTGTASGYGFTGAGSSANTYANGANVTFTLIMASSHAAGTTVSTSQLGTGITGAPLSSLVIDVFGSN